MCGNCIENLWPKLFFFFRWQIYPWWYHNGWEHGTQYRGCWDCIRNCWQTVHRLFFRWDLTLFKPFWLRYAKFDQWLYKMLWFVLFWWILEFIHRTGILRKIWALYNRLSWADQPNYRMRTFIFSKQKTFHDISVPAWLHTTRWYLRSRCRSLG